MTGPRRTMAKEFITGRAISNAVIGVGLLVLVNCTGDEGFNFDLRPNSSGVEAESTTIPRPEPDANGLITYDSYQMAVARSGDTVTDVAQRIGLDAEELARFNGRDANDTLRNDEVLALPRRVTPGSSGQTDIAALARDAIEKAEADVAPTGLTPQSGAEPIQHRVGRGETAFSISRLYNVSVRSLGEWNGLGPTMAVREGQYLIIPIAATRAAPNNARPPSQTAPAVVPASTNTPPPATATTTTTPPLRSDPIAPPTPIAPIEEVSPSPILTPPAAAPVAPPVVSSAPQETTNPEPASTSAAPPTAQFVRPVDGPIVRPYSGSNEGIDIAAATGTAVRAAGNGSVAAITQSTDQIPILVVRHDDGLLTVYANIQDISVNRGDPVTRGQTIARVGEGDPSFLHFEVRRGFDAQDPTEFLP